MNPLMAFGTYDECFSSHPAHGEHPVGCPFQVLEFLDLMNLKLFRPLSAPSMAVLSQLPEKEKDLALAPMET